MVIATFTVAAVVIAAIVVVVCWYYLLLLWLLLLSRQMDCSDLDGWENKAGNANGPTSTYHGLLDGIEVGAEQFKTKC